MKTACLMIDMQRFFFEENPSLRRTRLLENCIALVDTMRRSQVPVIHVHTLYEPNRSDWPRAWCAVQSEVWCDQLIVGSAGSRVAPGLEPRGGERIIRKRRFSGFYETALRSALQTLGIESVIVAGYSADVCVRFTAVDAYNYGYRIAIMGDCVEAFKEPTPTSLSYLRWLTDCTVLSLEQVQEYLASAAA